MTEELQPWYVRWREVRRRHYTSAEKLAEALQERGYEIKRWTPQRWEQAPPKGHRPRKYREALTDLHPDFAALIAELPDLPANNGDPTAELRQIIRQQGEETVARIQRLEERLYRALGVDPPEDE